MTSAPRTIDDGVLDYFDRQLGQFSDLPDVVKTKPTTVRDTTPLLGLAQTFIIQTIRTPDPEGKGKSGDWLFIEHSSRGQHYRLAFPPSVSAAIARQHEAVVSRSRSKAAKAKATRGINPFKDLTPTQVKSARAKALKTRKANAAKRRKRRAS